MTLEPKTPRTNYQRCCAALFGIEGFRFVYGGYRRLPKGRRAKSGQWWHPHRQPLEPKTVMEVIDEHHDSRRVMEAMGRCEIIEGPSKGVIEAWIEIHGDKA
jgi:hypothetical protein